jgi:1-acyl-sn-glycerol-3-phosphate acyltransferase
MIESRYATGNTARLWASLSPEDQRLFNFDVSGIDWHDYIGNVHIPGLKRNVLNLTDEGPAPAGERGRAARPQPRSLSADGESDSPLSASPGAAVGEPMLPDEDSSNGELDADRPHVNGKVDDVGEYVEESDGWGKVLVPKTAADDTPWLEVGHCKRMVRSLMRRLMRLYAKVWFDFEAHGVEHLPEGAFIVAANHCSHLDTGAVVTAFGERGGELFIMGARDYFFNRRLKGWFFHTFLNIIPFNRTEAMIKGLRLARSVLHAGRPVLIFPEGTRSKDGQLQPFKPGIGLLGLELGVPIVPCHIEGTHAALPKGKAVPRRAKIRVTFAPPITMAEYRARHPAADRRQLYRCVAEDVRAVIANMQGAGG